MSEWPTFIIQLIFHIIQWTFSSLSDPVLTLHFEAPVYTICSFHFWIFRKYLKRAIFLYRDGLVNEIKKIVLFTVYLHIYTSRTKHGSFRLTRSLIICQLLHYVQILIKISSLKTVCLFILKENSHELR